ncbi:MAG: tetratricopeptide repeat protein [Actinomycetia bacterium]|nr:tetratricopeptide repeat protein [Actinomycetes bacterium]
MVGEETKWQERFNQAARDLEELRQQLVENEIPASTGRRLADTYLEEMEEAKRRIRELQGRDRDSQVAEQAQRSTGFWTLGRIVVAAILGSAAVALVLAVGWFVNPEEQVASDPQFDPTRYSNETMEAVIAANADHPQINGMRLALAARYIQSGELSAAFPHYREVLERNPHPEEEAEALSRLGWMAWAGSGETQLAIETLDRALEAGPEHPQALYFKAIVLWCGAGQAQQAVPLLGRVLEMLPSETEVAAELAAARAGEECR